MGKMIEVLFDYLYAFVGIGVDSMNFCVDDWAELNDKLLKPSEI